MRMCELTVASLRSLIGMPIVEVMVMARCHGRLVICLNAVRLVWGNSRWLCWRKRFKPVACFGFEKSDVLPRR